MDSENGPSLPGTEFSQDVRFLMLTLWGLVPLCLAHRGTGNVRTFNVPWVI